MKLTIMLLACILFFTPSIAQAEDRHAWTKTDTALQTGFITLVLIDWKQTREFTGNRSKYPTKYESNPLLPAHPTAREVNRFVAGSIIAHTGIAYLLPRPYRTIWQSIWIGIEGEAVLSNYVAGITTHF